MSVMSDFITNAELRVEAERLCDENERLQAENTKLRELVRDMWHEGAFEPGACYEKAAEILEERTRELGIEVD